MQRQQGGGFRRFVQKPAGKAILLALTILIVFATDAYVSQLLAIPAMLVFGLALPIWMGLKRPRYLALSGLVVILIVAPLATAVFTQELRAPIGVASSSTSLPGGNGQAVMQNASVTPYTGSTSTNFTWQVTVFGQNVPKGNTTPLNVTLYLSTCPGATSTSPPPWCSAGYPFYSFTKNLSKANFTIPVVVSFHFTIGSAGVWDWQMGLYTKNTTTGNLSFMLLVGDPTYNGIEGPVVGDFLTTFSEIVLTIYFDSFVFLGAPFFILLLVYMLFKNRERRRKEAQQRAAGPVPPGTTPPESATPAPPPSSTVPGAGSAPLPGAKERTCPNCNAVVYENETTCWKCGARLVESPPLPSGH